eukprot:CAMPEP_0119339096 /NCGR_PEP_ID=MMETSP1333-20130426/97580_1 /TAXON_ID=418940 /ORGANISM="Scyphosphaera apsteinii, Strain RCC1455" /LENGTH=80 /DNA_ID=CAMNT_0007350565 /DNA_START=116 /DNA_END=355 /DNA_ORIENTATION=-
MSPTKNRPDGINQAATTAFAPHHSINDRASHKAAWSGTSPVRSRLRVPSQPKVNNQWQVAAEPPAHWHLHIPTFSSTQVV